MDERLLSFAGSGDGVFAVDAEQRIVFWNDALAGLVGITAKEALYRPCWAVLQGTDRDGQNVCSPDCPTLQRARVGETLPSSELVLRHRDDGLVPTRVAHISPGHEKTARQPFLLVHLLRHTPGPAEQTGKLRIQLLGATRVWQADGTLVTGGAWKNMKVRCVLGFLAMQPRQRATRQQVQEALWPHLTHDKQRAGLDAALAGLRGCLDVANGSRFVGGSGVFRLSEDCWVDAIAFDQRIHRARLELDAGRAIGLYQEAVALYGGYYMADLDALEPWCLVERQRLHRLYLAALEELGLLYESVGLAQSALIIYYRLLEVEPEHAGARRHLFRLADRPGESIAAVRTCTWLARTLASELERLGGDMTTRDAEMLAAG